MIPDYKCRSRQKNNRRELTSPVVPSVRAKFSRGIDAGVLNQHTNKMYRRFVKAAAKHQHISKTAGYCAYTPFGYYPFPF